MSTAEEKKFSIKHVFTDVMNMDEKFGIQKKRENHFNIPWELGIHLSFDEFEFCLKCDPLPGTETNDWSIETEIELKVSNELKGQTHVVKRIYSKDYRNCEPRNSSIERQKMPEYLNDGNLAVECHVRIIKMTKILKKKLMNFDESMKKFSDVVLIVDDEKFYVQKMHLASHSPYFNSLFFENASEPGQLEITLDDVDSQDFQCFLELINGAQSIDDNFVFGILKLADKFDSKIAIDRCEEFLMKESKHSSKEKFQTAVTHKMEQLKKKCISDMKTLADIMLVVPEDANEIDESTWKEFLNHALYLDLLYNPLDSSMDGSSCTNSSDERAEMDSAVGGENMKEKLRSFDESMKKFSDVVLNVNHEKFYVLKTYLASHSSYFESLFNGSFNESKQSEITLNVDPKDFQHFLELIHGESAIDDDTIDGILYLADMYDSQTAIRRCEEFLVEKSKQTMQEKFESAVVYQLDKLKKKCLSEMKSPDDIRSVVPDCPTNFDPSTWKELLLHLASFQ